MTKFTSRWVTTYTSLRVNSLPTHYQGKALNEDKLLLVLHLIEGVPRGDFKYLHYSVFKERIYDYKVYVSALLEYQLIATTPHKVGRSTGYRILHQNLTWVQNDTMSPYSPRKISLCWIKHHRIIKKDNEKFFKRHTFLKHLNSPDFNLCTQNAIEFLNRSFYEGQMSIDRYRRMQFIAHKFNSQDHYIHRKGIDKRVHWRLTHFPSMLRRFLSWKGEPLVWCDLKSSQPFILVSIMQAILDQNEDRLRLFASCTDEKAFWLNRFSLINLKSDEVGLFRSIVLENDLYSHIVEGISPEVLEVITCEEGFKVSGRKVEYTKTERDWVKKAFMEFLYSKPKNNSLQARVIREVLPSSIVELVNELKIDQKGFSRGNILSTLLQNIESYIFIDVLCKRIKMPLFPCHDALVTSFSKKDELVAEMTMHIETVTGLIPKVVVEVYD